MERFYFFRRFLFLLALWSNARAFCQSSTATVTGTVQDSSKASIPEASVKLINTQTGAENDAITGHDGSFALPGVIPGSYLLQIERQGFATTQLHGITLDVGDSRDLLIRLKVGAVAESVTVDASGHTLNRTDGSVSTVVDRKLAESVPLNGRNLQDLISMTPGIVTQNPQAAGQRSETQGEFSVNGQQPEANSFYVDGLSADFNGGLLSGHARTVSTGSAAGATALGTTQSLVPVEALQEFRVLTSSYSAEYGRTPGGQFTFLTRSGTDDPHGTLFYNFRSNTVDAIDWFAEHYSFEGIGTRFSQNNFGGALGMPVVLRQYDGRDRTFLFVAYEGLYVPQPTPQTFQYSPAYNFNDIPSALLPVLECFPQGGPPIDVASGNIAGLGEDTSSPFALPSHLNSTSVRLDHTFSPKLAVFFRYGKAPSFSQSMQLYSLTANHLSAETSAMGMSGRLSARLSNEMRLGLTRNDSNVHTSTLYNNLDSAIGIPATYSSVSSQAYIHIVGVGDSETFTNAARDSVHQWNLRDTFNLEASHHLFKFGLDERRIALMTLPPELTVQADFFDSDSLLNNSVSALVVTQATRANPLLNQFSLFAQDEWKLSTSLSLSLGLRWELDPPPKGKHGQDAYAVRGDVHSAADLYVAPRGTPLWHTSWYNFAPRIGSAWAVQRAPGKELILRAGGGVFFDAGNQPALQAFSGLGFSSSAHYSNVPLPVTQAQLDVPAGNGANGFAFPSHLQLPYSWQWNVSLEKALGKHQTMTVSYVGASGQRLLQAQRENANQANKALGEVTFFPSGLTSNYEAMQAKFQRALVQGVQTLVSYTWAHGLDYGSTDPAFPLIHGNSDFDVRQNLEAALSWDLPRPVGNYLMRNLFGGWRVDGRLLARTGFPVDLAGNLFLDSITGNTYFSGVDLIPKRPLYLQGQSYPGGRIFNGGPSALDPAFRLPQGNEQGNAPRNLLRGFPASQENVAVRRSFHVHDSTNLQIGVEMFNVGNHPNFGYIDPHLPDLLFGQSTKLLNQSFGTTGSLYQQGGPRSMQISLKLVF